MEEPTFSPRAWRENLLQRLLYVVVPTALLALVAALSGSSNRQRAVLLGTVGSAVGWLALVAFQREWPYILRAGSLVGTFVLATFVAYFLVGFHGNAALLAAHAVVMAGLFLGRRPMLAVLALLFMAPVLAGAGMVTGILPLPDAARVSAANVGPWMRTAVVAVLGWTMIGLAVTHAVAQIEGAVAKEHAAVRGLRDEQLKRAFLATISHELRTPLNGVLGMVDLLSRTSLALEQKHCVDVARSSAKLLLSVINDMLDFSKIEAGRLDLERIPFELDQVISDARSMLALGAEQKGLGLSSEMAPDLPRALVGDPARVCQVLVNLVSNAVKFTPAGEIVVRATLETESSHDATIRLEVRDTGIGIAEDAQERLFRPFSQVDASTTRHFGGTGLGLAICHGIIEQMGGTIGVRSAPGSGSTFWFVVRFGKSEPIVSLPTAPAAHVLLVEDSEVNAEVAGGILRAAGYSCDRVGDGQRAIEAAGTGRYDLVLMDCHLPGLDGYEATRMIRAREASTAPSGAMGRLPILALTASVTKEDQERAVASGMDGSISKPLDAGRFLAAVAAGLSNASRRERASSLEKQGEPSLCVADLDRASQRLQGDRALLERVMRQLVSGAPEEKVRLEQAVRQRDLPAVRYAVHRLRGQAAAFEAASLMSAIDQLMNQAATLRWTATEALTQTVHRELDRLVEELSRDVGPQS